jgi:hypothetical protein
MLPLETVARIERRATAWNDALTAGLKEAGRERARGRRAEREAADARALVARIAAERQDREAQAESGPAPFTDSPGRVCPTVGALAAWVNEQIGRPTWRTVGTTTACPEMFAGRLDALADLVADLAQVAERIYAGGYETAAELRARDGWTAAEHNRVLSKARTFADLLAVRAYQARLGCDTVATWARQGARARAVKNGQDFAAAGRALCVDVVRAGRDCLWSPEAHRAVRSDVLAAVDAFLTLACVH